MITSGKPSSGAGNLRRQAEAAVRGKASASPEAKVPVSPEAARQLVHELQVHHVELELQNEELRRAQVELEAMRARYFDLYDLAPVGYCTLDEDGLILEANMMAASLLSTNRNALIKQPFSRFVFPEDSDAFYHHRMKILATGEPQAWELRMVKSGAPDAVQPPFWAQLAATAARDVACAPVIRLVLSDINERRQREARLRDEQERLRTILDTAGSPLFVKGDDCRVVLANRAFFDFFGVDERTVIGSTLAAIIPEEQMRRALDVDRRVLESGEPYQCEESLTVNGSARTIITTKSRFVEQSGKRYLVGAIHDITERKRSERLLVDSHEQLCTLLSHLKRAQEEERTRISREIHDELGQLLTGLKMDVRWLERKLSEPGLPPSLNPLLDRVVGTNELADAMLATVQRIASELRPSTLDTLGLEATIALEARRFQDRSGVHCTVTQADCFPVLPTGIASELFYICREALTNVGRHAHATHVGINWCMEGETAVFTVCDDGVGMVESEVGTRQSLGLTGMRERAIQCGGSITFERNQPAGTRVTVLVPRAAAAVVRSAPQ
jgi:PAS domain S-box-containing protein